MTAPCSSPSTTATATGRCRSPSGTAPTRTKAVRPARDGKRSGRRQVLRAACRCDTQVRRDRQGVGVRAEDDVGARRADEEGEPQDGDALELHAGAPVVRHPPRRWCRAAARVPPRRDHRPRRAHGGGARSDAIAAVGGGGGFDLGAGVANTAAPIGPPRFLVARLVDDVFKLPGAECRPAASAVSRRAPWVWRRRSPSAAAPRAAPPPPSSSYESGLGVGLEDGAAASGVEPVESVALVAAAGRVGGLLRGSGCSIHVNKSCEQKLCPG